MNPFMRPLQIFCVLIVAILVAACSSSPPSRPDDVCAIFDEKPGWYRGAKQAREAWGTPIGVQMAIIHQESRYQSSVRPPRKRLLGLIPTFRPSNAYGYGQAKDETWEWYQTSTGQSGADRDDFADVADFIGWYTALSQRKLGISKWDGRNQYLAYHEGHGGYARKTYLKKKWLINVAARVDRRAKQYNQQLKGCEADLDSGWSLWPF